MFYLLKVFPPWYLPQQGNAVGNQDLVSPSVVFKLTSCLPPDILVLFGLWLRCQRTLWHSETLPRDVSLFLKSQ